MDRGDDADNEEDGKILGGEDVLLQSHPVESFYHPDLRLLATAEGGLGRGGFRPTRNALQCDAGCFLQRQHRLLKYAQTPVAPASIFATLETSTSIHWNLRATPVVAVAMAVTPVAGVVAGVMAKLI